jgi:putative transposase
MTGRRHAEDTAREKQPVRFTGRSDTVEQRCRVNKTEAGSRAAGLAMTFKLIESAQARCRAVNAPGLVALVRAGAGFERGLLVERFDAAAA